jgi:hypothetical protein
VLPKASAGAELRVGWIAGWLVIELQAAGWLARSKRVQALDGAGGDFALFGVNLVAGYRAALWAGGQGRLALGAGGKRMKATGFGVSRPGSATGYWAGALAEASLAQALGSNGLSLALRAGADLPLNPPRFAIRGVGPVHRPGPIAGFVALGLELQF